MAPRSLRCLLLSLLVALTLPACASHPDPAPATELEITAWAIQLQGFDAPGAVDRLARVRADLVVIDPVRNVTGRSAWPARSVVAQIRSHRGPAGHRKRVLAYVNVGQAERYRAYWGEHWVAPTSGASGEPSFLVADDPDGWADNFPVAFWRPEWQTVVLDGVLGGVLSDEFDGVFLDWVAGWSDPRVRVAAERDGVEPAEAMATLIETLAATARRRRPGFLVVPLNAAPLIRRVPRLAGVIDAVVQEPVLFGGAAHAAWDEPASAGARIPAEGDFSTAAILRDCAAVRALGVPVLALDYAACPDDVREARDVARRHGLVPFVSRSPLDRLPDTTLR